MGQQEAALRRRAPGKQFIGDRAAQSSAARQAERRKVERMAEVDAATRAAEDLGAPVSAILAELAQDTFRLARSLALAPFRIAYALVRRPAHAPQ